MFTRKALALGLLTVDYTVAPLIFPVYAVVTFTSAAYHIVRGTKLPIEHETSFKRDEKEYVARVRIERAG